MRSESLLVVFFSIWFLSTFPGCTKKSTPKATNATSLYGISYYRGVDFPAELVFISILNPKHTKIRDIIFLEEPQSLLSDRVVYGPQNEKNLVTWGISSSKYLGFDSVKIREDLLKNITSNKIEIIYGDSTTQTIDIDEVPYFKFIEKRKSDTIPETFWRTLIN